MNRFAIEADATHTQIRPHAGFASGPIHLRQPTLMRPREEAPVNRRVSLAPVAEWTEQSKCLSWDEEREVVRNGDWSPWDDDYANANRARALCEGCPVILLCLNAALEEEAGKGVTNRHGVRGGLNPAGRTKLEFGAVCRRCGGPLAAFNKKHPTGRCHRCEASQLRARRALRKVDA